MAVSSYIVFQQGQNEGWTILATVEAPTADAAIEQARTGPGTFVAVLARSFRPRTHYTPPKPATTTPRGPGF